jgi:hypothetical protein
MRHIQVIRQNFVASTMAIPLLLPLPLPFGSSWHAPPLLLPFNFLDLEFSPSWPTGMLIIFQTVSPLCKTFVPLKHGIMAQDFFTVCLLDHLKGSASRFA